jgi:hypothetical protein
MQPNVPQQTLISKDTIYNVTKIIGKNSKDKQRDSTNYFPRIIK